MADLNLDGLADLVAVDHEGFLALYERKRTNSGLILTPGRRIFQRADQKDAVVDANGGPLRLDFNKDGVNDLAQRGPGGAVLYRYSDRTSDRDVVRSAATVFSPGEDLPIVNPSEVEARWFRANGIWAGGSGRRQMILCDWDGDGQLDLVANSKSMNLLRNVGEKGSFVFRDEGPLVGAVLAGHTTCPTLADLDRDGVKELVVGAEDGFLYHYDRAETKKP